MNRLNVLRVRLQCRAELLNRGYHWADISEVIEAVDEKQIKVCASEIGITAIGDGTIIGAIIDFLKSPQGQELIAALVKMLIGLLAGL